MKFLIHYMGKKNLHFKFIPKDEVVLMILEVARGNYYSVQLLPMMINSKNL